MRLRISRIEDIETPIEKIKYKYYLYYHLSYYFCLFYR